jgi:hypothetical protein
VATSLLAEAEAKDESGLETDGHGLEPYEVRERWRFEPLGLKLFCADIFEHLLFFFSFFFLSPDIGLEDGVKSELSPELEFGKLGLEDGVKSELGPELEFGKLGLEDGDMLLRAS